MNPIRKTNPISGLLFGIAAVLNAPAQTANPLQYYFTTFAGSSSIGSVDGVGSVARFNMPLGCAVDATGNTYIADTFNHTIRKVSPTGVTTTLAGKAGAAGSDDGTGSAARFNRPTGIAVNSTGIIFVADSDTRKIRKISPAGVVTTLAANLAGAPLPVGGYAINQIGLAVDASDNVYTADFAESIVQKITLSGTVSTVAGIIGQRGNVDGPASQAQIAPMGGIAIDRNGIIYITEPGAIRKIIPGGNVSILAGVSAFTTGMADGTGTMASFNYPRGVTIDPAGNLYVADSFNDIIRKVTSSGVVTTLAGKYGPTGNDDGPAASATFWWPTSIALDSAGNLVVTDSTNNTLRKITPAGQVSTLAGLSPDKSKGNVDGAGGAARFFGPAGMAIASTGDIYVADVGNHTIRKISPSGIVSTVAGLAGQSGYLDGPATSALFTNPNCLAIDSSGNLFVSDYGNGRIRKISPAGMVTTVANETGQGLATDTLGNIYVTQGRVFKKIDLSGAVSSLGYSVSIQDVYNGISFDPAGNLYVSGTELAGFYRWPSGSIGTSSAPVFTASQTLGAIFADNNGQLFGTDTARLGESRVFKVTMDGSSQTIGGQAYAWGNTDGVGTAALFNGTRGIVADRAGNIYISCADDNTIRKGVPAGPPTIATQPQNATVAQNGNVQFSVSAGGVPDPTYQWYFNGSAFSGATSNTLSFANARSTDAGNYTVTVTNSLGTVTSNKATLTVSAAPVPTPAPSPAAGGGGSLEAWFALALLALIGMRHREFHRGK